MTGGVGRYARFALYMAAMVLINIAGLSLYVRADLTSEGAYSLSEASKQCVRSLSEPLTVKVFFTRDLPAPYNGTERYLADLLEEYAAAGGRLFNYEFMDVTEDGTERTEANRRMAESYGVAPVQIQNIEKDELKFQKAYMGLALIHGDMVEHADAAGGTEGLEYRLTIAIQRMNDKVSALLRLKEPVSVDLYLSSSLKAVAPYMNISGLGELPAAIEAEVGKLNKQNYGKLAYRHMDPTLDPSARAEAEKHRVISLKWDALRLGPGREVPAGTGFAGIVITHGQRSETLDVLNVFSIPLFGTQYKLESAEDLSARIEQTMENLINVNEDVGYLSGHGTAPLGTDFQMPGMPSSEDALNSFSKLVRQRYALSEVDISDGIPESLPALIIAGPTEEFSDYELYRIDQYLMRGRNLLLFLDPFMEKTQGQDQLAMRFGRSQPVYEPLSTGLEKLLEHYGAILPHAYVLDENSYKQRAPKAFGGGETQIYFAPIIQKDNINTSLPFLRNIKGLVTLKNSPVEIRESTLKNAGITAERLFSSSGRSWEMSGFIVLNPNFIRPPESDEKMGSRDLAYLLEGPFPSYFAGRPMPEKPDSDSEDKDDKPAMPEKPDKKGPAIVAEGQSMQKGRPGKIFVVGTSELLKDNMLDEAGQAPNSQFLLNVLDYMNGHEEYALMRSKTQGLNPLDEIKPGTRSFVKALNIGGLPVLTALFGLGAWLWRARRKRLITQIFTR